MSDYIADVTFIIEGSYPYVSGGVASWCHQLVCNMPDIQFDLVILQATSKDPRVPKYELPKNVINLYHVPLYAKLKRPLFLYKSFPGYNLFLEAIDEKFSIESLERLVDFCITYKGRKHIRKKMIFSQTFFKLMEELFHSENLQGKSFLTYFWLLRSLINGYLSVLSAPLPKAKIYHAVSTGYAGLMATVLHTANPNSVLMLTEHGIYTRERTMELSIAEWPDQDRDNYIPEFGGGFYKRLWGNSFALMSHFIYKYANPIISLYQKNNDLQIEEGAEPWKVSTIPNGIDLSLYSFRERKKVADSPQIGFIGRIVKIKDVKCLIRAAEIVVAKHPTAQFQLAGPSEEDEDYFEDCKELVSLLNLQDNLHFLGRTDAKAFYETIDIMVLTSLSEGQPLVMLEAAACGIPIVASDVGGCSEIVYEKLDGLHQCGLVTLQKDPKSTARALIRLIEEPEFFNACSKAGRLRVETKYSQKKLIDTYHGLYTKHLELYVSET
ncbi:MAG: GT4 family glycosyltransferase PelF [Candidatus Cloacimonetes bacterium]|nr:GT4 family glycosyltransferase PelF [Candidatus Cloacimonadota bacterium]